MYYVFPTNKPFRVNGDFDFNKKPSEESIAIKKFIDSHNFSVSLDPQTGEPVVEVTEKTSE